MTPEQRAALVEKVARRMGEAISLWLHEHPGCVLEDVDTPYIATAVIDLIRAEVLEEAMAAAYSPATQQYIAGNEQDADGLYPPGSPYDRGRYEARAAIRKLKEK